MARKHNSVKNPGHVHEPLKLEDDTLYGFYSFSNHTGLIFQLIKYAALHSNEAHREIAAKLKENPVGSQNFKDTWKRLGISVTKEFGNLQDEFAKFKFYDYAVKSLELSSYNVEDRQHTDALKAVVFSCAVRFQSLRITTLFAEVCTRLRKTNLAQIDDAYYDDEVISEIYDFLIEECDAASPTFFGFYRSPNGWIIGSLDAVAFLRSCFARERADALGMLTGHPILL